MVKVPQFDLHKITKKLNTKNVRIAAVISLIAALSLPRLFHISEEGPSEKLALIVQAISPEAASAGATITGYGTVEPSRTLEVRPQIGGTVVEQSPNLIEGGRIEKDELLFQFDSREFEINLEAKRAQVTRAESNLKLEQGNQIVAAHEWKLFKQESEDKEAQHELALRVPQLKDKQAALQEAMSDLKNAQLTLERTKMFTPFNALVLENHVEIGTYFFPGTLAAKLAATDTFFIRVRVPEESLSLLEFDPKTGSPTNANKVTLIQESQNGREYRRPGKLELVVGSLDSEGRMAQVLVSIPDPLSTKNGTPPLLIGSYLRVEILGRTVGNTFRIPRSAMREQNQIYVADTKNLLRIRRPEIVYATADSVVVRNGLRTDDRVIVSNISSALEGTRLRVQELLEAD